MAHSSKTYGLLLVFARLHPEIYDFIFPHGPVVARVNRFRASDRLARVALNPQPLPPVELLIFEARQTANSIAEAVITAHSTGQDYQGILREVDDDWCGTVPRPKFPWPRKWPFPWPPGEPYPIDQDLLL